MDGRGWHSRDRSYCGQTNNQEEEGGVSLLSIGFTVYGTLK
jgi:hypothetical protein